MANIVYAWELGGGFGHIHAFLPIALRLQNEGHSICFIVRDLLNAERELNRHGFRALQAPLFQGRLVGLPEPAMNMAEILLHQGFLRDEHLGGLVKAWRAMFELLNADFIVCDYAPAALVAARATGTLAATFGTGFCRPPDIFPTPNLQPWLAADQPRLTASENRVVETVNSVLAQFSVESIRQVSDIFSREEDFLCTYTELDPYPDRPAARYWGAVYNSELGEEMAWSGRQKFRIFCYLKPALPGLKEIILQLRKLRRHEVVLFCPGLASSLIDKYASPQLKIVPRPARLEQLVASCSAAVCQAGHGMVAAMLHAGVPLLLLPTNLEQYLTSQRVVGLGAGLMLDLEEDRPDCLPLLGKLLEDDSYRGAAEGFSLKYQRHSLAKVQELIHQRILEFCATGSTAQTRPGFQAAEPAAGRY